jgi:isoquinoline 1-oxidoreductase
VCWTTVEIGSVVVNGVSRDARLVAERSLLEVLREDLLLTGAKPGCGEGACGACTVLLDGAPVRACVTPASAAAGHSVTTIEGLAVAGELHPVQREFLKAGAVQCGYCTPGMVLAAVALLAIKPDPDEAEIRSAMAGNVCRCCSYAGITRAVRRAATAIREREPETHEHAGLPMSGAFWEFRPRAPWGLVDVEQREYFELLGDGLVVILAPDQKPAGPGSFPLQTGGAWLHVGVDRGVTAFTGKVDIGQDNLTALALIVADELRVAPERVRLVMGDSDLCPFDPGTFGSRSLPGAGEDLRRCAAYARERLARGVEMAPGLRQAEMVSGELQLTPPAQWRHRGHPTPRATARALVNGAHRFPSDLARPGMLRGLLLRPPAYGATIRTIDLGPAQALPGITVVCEQDMVAVAAQDLPGARQALDAIDVEWDLTEQPAQSGLSEHLRSHPIEGVGWEGRVQHELGDVEQALDSSEQRLERSYATAYIAHASLETRVALAEWAGGRLTVFTGTQQPFFVRSALAAALGVAEEQVRVIVPGTGGGFGSKHTEDVAIAAARLARAAGAPVKVALSREEEFVWTYLRPAALIDVRSGARRDGMITAWDFANINSGAAGLSCPYQLPDRRETFQPADAPLPQGPYRALAATANHFARESHIDELAHALDLDPLELRLQNLSDQRLAAVLNASAERADWVQTRQQTRPGAGIGIALGFEKGGRVATCIRVRIINGELEIEQIVTAYECGAVVNPANVCTQIEGATIMGLGGALFEAIRFDAGRILNASLRAYRVPRFTDVPPIDVVLLDRPDLPSAGAGETPIVAVAPALANAIFAAGGPRIRSLPLLPDLALVHGRQGNQPGLRP